jgi:hypothetical protein
MENQISSDGYTGMDGKTNGTTHVKSGSRERVVSSRFKLTTDYQLLTTG